ncbi:MAG: peptidoglycan-binding protein [Campylobacteraceae bacterium]|nr:peptidoglycan-binding protein [Campylobacteraceae bacterium]
MFKMLLVISLITSFSYAGFWSSVAGGVVANSLSSSGSKRSIDYRQTEGMKIQQALYGLGFYDSKLDGNLNTLDSRMAINKFQESFGLEKTGIVSDTNKQHLLFLHELYSSLIKEYNNKEKRNFLFDEIDKAIALIKGNN